MMHQGLPIPPTKNDADWKTACGLALKAVEKAGKTMAGVQVGKTMVLYKAVQVRHTAHPSTVRTDLQHPLARFDFRSCSTKRWS
jgi:hypothetical protein